MHEEVPGSFFRIRADFIFLGVLGTHSADTVSKIKFENEFCSCCNTFCLIKPVLDRSAVGRERGRAEIPSTANNKRLVQATAEKTRKRLGIIKLS